MDMIDNELIHYISRTISDTILEQSGVGFVLDTEDREVLRKRLTEDGKRYIASFSVKDVKARVQHMAKNYVIPKEYAHLTDEAYEKVFVEFMEKCHPELALQHYFAKVCTQILKKKFPNMAGITTEEGGLPREPSILENIVPIVIDKEPEEDEPEPKRGPIIDYSVLDDNYSVVRTYKEANLVPEQVHDLVRDVVRKGIDARTMLTDEYIDHLLTQNGQVMYRCLDVHDVQEAVGESGYEDDLVSETKARAYLHLYSKLETEQEAESVLIRDFDDEIMTISDELDELKTKNNPVDQEVREAMHTLVSDLNWGMSAEEINAAIEDLIGNYNLKNLYREEE